MHLYELDLNATLVYSPFVPLASPVTRIYASE